MYQKFKTLLPLLIFVIILNYNFAYSIDYQKTEISAYGFDTYKITDNLVVSDLNQGYLELDIVPCYDLLVKINNQKINSYSYDTDKLTINVAGNLKSATIDIIYLTDYYANKQNGIWTVNYNSRYKEKIDEIKIILPKGAKLIDASGSVSAEVINGQLTVSFKDTSAININYELIQKPSNTNYYILSVVLILTIMAIRFGLKKRTRKKNIKNLTAQNKEDLLLGLNENEQKIIKVIMENPGQTQKLITAKSFLPKGTVSRNIKKLSDKGYIEIKKYGVSNKIFLGEVFKK